MSSASWPEALPGLRPRLRDSYWPGISPSLDGLSDEALAEAASGGSEPHFELLVRRHTRSAYRVAYSVCGDSGEAEDIIQESFMKLHRAFPGYRRGEPLRPWLLRIVVNTARSSLRARKCRPAAASGDFDDLTGSGSVVPRTGSPDDIVPLRLDFADALASIPVDYRQVVALRSAEDLSFAEIGEILGVPEATARTRFHRAKSMLAARLKSSG